MLHMEWIVFARFDMPQTAAKFMWAWENKSKADHACNKISRPNIHDSKRKIVPVSFHLLSAAICNIHQTSTQVMLSQRNHNFQFPRTVKR